MTLLIQVPNQEIRDAILASGMEHGLQISYNLLEDLVRPAASRFALRRGAAYPAVMVALIRNCYG